MLKVIEYYGSAGNNRNDGVVRAYASGGCCMEGIGKHFGLYYSRMSSIVIAAKKKDFVICCDSGSF